MRSLLCTQGQRPPDENQEHHGRGVHRREAGRGSPAARARPAAAPEPPIHPRREVCRVRPPLLMPMLFHHAIPLCLSTLADMHLRLSSSPLHITHPITHHATRGLQIPQGAAVTGGGRERRRGHETDGRGARRGRPARQAPPRTPEGQQELQDKSEARRRALRLLADFVSACGALQCDGGSLSQCCAQDRG